ncbi:peptide deformylase [Rhizobium sp. ARZ01]|uniref:peptide deformylase n=1 Tax=Rhizobium sp. ARZ01 TaxID=2769313 RepID=UPI001781EF2D|nr:peptide deformylase [Rhizobium sp. ARZ01]MBD9372496.1 peptide deformylase [Rhizobium sp. ARZ01]
MTVRPIVRFPDERLRTPCQSVTQFDDTLAALAGDLAETMRAAPGIGITAAHIGQLLRLVVIELDGRASTQIYVNPAIEWSSDETGMHMEGSVSMPGVTEEVTRPSRVRVSYFDLAGTAQIVEADGLLAVCLQHEIDQLGGIFWIDRLSRLKRERIVKKFRKLQMERG